MRKGETVSVRETETAEKGREKAPEIKKVKSKKAFTANNREKNYKVTITYRDRYSITRKSYQLQTKSIKEILQCANILRVLIKRAI